MTVEQRDIIELNYQLPNGKFKTHPALVISNSNVLEVEDIFYAVMIFLHLDKHLLIRYLKGFLKQCLKRYARCESDYSKPTNITVFLFKIILLPPVL